MKPGKRNRKNQIGEHFAPILKSMVKGPAWERLTNAARVAYVMLKAECNHAGQNEVKLPYSDIRKIMKTDTFARSIRQLEALGFIEITQHGGLYRRTNTYKFIEDWRKIK